MTMTYGSTDKHLGGPTYGGYSQSIVVTRIRAAHAGEPRSRPPRLRCCARASRPIRRCVTGRSAPARRSASSAWAGSATWRVKFANAFGAHVVLFTTSPGKIADAQRLGAHEVVISKDEAQMAAHAGSFDFILDTVSAAHDINAYINLLKRDGNMMLVGAPEKPLPVAAFPLLIRRRSFSGSLIGGLPETQEMLDFCGKHNITCDIEMIRMDQINEAYERMLKSDVKYRFVIDMASLK